MKFESNRPASRLIRVAALATITGGVLVWPALAAIAADPAPAIEVSIAKFAFAPQQVTVTPGTTIVWTNQDGAPHTVTSDDKSFASKGMDTGDKFEHTFTSEGDFRYICTVHPFMTGVVHVRR
jgi:plastocyanin